MNSLLKFFYSPMVMTSLFLHGLLLIMPLPARPPAEPPPEAEEPEAEEVRLSSLQSLTKPSATPKPIPKASPKAPPPAPKPIVRPAARVAPTAPPRRPPPAPSPLPPAAAPVPASPAAEPSSVATAPSPEPQVEQQLQDYLGEFQSSLGAVGASETAGLGIPYYLFPQAELFFTAESIAAADSSPDAQPVQVEGIEDILWASRKRPDAALEELRTLFQGFTFAEAGEFGGGAVYQVSQGSTVRYVNLVQATDRTATFVVIWNRDPNSTQAAAP